MLQAIKVGDFNKYNMEVISIDGGLLEVVCRNCQLRDFLQANRFEFEACNSTKCTKRREGMN